MYLAKRQNQGPFAKLAASNFDQTLNTPMQLLCPARNFLGGLFWPRTQTRRGRRIILPPLPAEEVVAVQEEAEEGKVAGY
jgi:hypothetical protein